MSEAWRGFDRFLAEDPDWPPTRTASLGVLPGGRRRVQVLRRIELWSALKVSLLLYLSVLAGLLLVGVGLWTLGRQTGTIGNLESLIEDLYAAESYRFDGAKILKVSAVLGPIVAVVASLATVVGVALFNGVSRMSGGVRVTMADLEREDVAL
ncbi:MAG: DUF3566 domain-containing protein [Acidimicrobiia bacterium]